MFIVFERNRSAERNDITQSDSGLRHGNVAGKGVQYAARFARREFLQRPDNFFVRVAVVDANRQIQFRREFQLLFEKCLLQIRRRFVPIKIQTDFADGNYFGMRGKFAQNFKSSSDAARTLSG